MMLLSFVLKYQIVGKPLFKKRQGDSVVLVEVLL